MNTKTLTEIDWSQVLDDIPQNATEAVVTDRFIGTLIKALGFNKNEYHPQFATGNNSDKVDFATRKNTAQSNFSEDQKILTY
uniref:Uncharacterized protein n=1 Tax=Desertifilum tharense IPPAS B-1220 TaxID=1781255 RepID=A0ACD5H258_9CYAN